MGWCSGSYLAEDLWDRIRPDIPKSKRRRLARIFIDKFSDHDADDWSTDTKLWKDAKLPTEED